VAKRELVADWSKWLARSPCWIASLIGESGASLSSHTRKQFHTANRSDSGSHRHQCVAKRTDVRNLFRTAASKNSLPDLLIAASSMIEGAERSGGQLDLTTAFEHFQITNVHSTDSYGPSGRGDSSRGELLEAERRHPSGSRKLSRGRDEQRPDPTVVLLSYVPSPSTLSLTPPFTERSSTIGLSKGCRQLGP
jgi:hypothetical protein